MDLLLKSEVVAVTGIKLSTQFASQCWDSISFSFIAIHMRQFTIITVTLSLFQGTLQLIFPHSSLSLSTPYSLHRTDFAAFWLFFAFYPAQLYLIFQFYSASNFSVDVMRQSKLQQFNIKYLNLTVSYLFTLTYFANQFVLLWFYHFNMNIS